MPGRRRPFGLGLLPVCSRKLFADSLQTATDSAFRAAEFSRDIALLLTLEPSCENISICFTKSGHQHVQLVGDRCCFDGGRIPSQDLLPAIRKFVCLSSYIAAVGRMASCLTRQFAQRHRDQQRPQIVTGGNIDTVLIGGHKKAAPRRHHHVFGVHSTPQPMRKPAAGQSRQANHVATDEKLSGLLAAVPPRCQQLLIGRILQHRESFARQTGRI